MRPRIVVDLTFAFKSPTGTRVYAERIAAALAARDDLDVQCVTAQPVMPRAGAGNLFTGARNLWWLQVELPRVLARQRADLAHAAAFLGPPTAPCPLVVNILDVIYLESPQDYDTRWRLYARLWIPRTVRRANRLITLSEYSKARIVDAYHVRPDRVRVIYPGIGDEFRAPQDPARIAAVREQYGLDDYILFVGASEPRKNVAAAVDALAELRPRFPNLQLALAGPRGGGWSAVAAAVARHTLQEAVRELGMVPPDHLPALYAGARALVFPSRVEGFGIPLIEAMASGTPVVAAPNPPTPEVVGDAALLAGGAEGPALAEALGRVLDDPAMAGELRRRGLARAAQFSWERAARETAEVYRELIFDARAAREVSTRGKPA